MFVMIDTAKACLVSVITKTTRDLAVSVNEDARRALALSAITETAKASVVSGIADTRGALFQPLVPQPSPEPSRVQSVPIAATAITASPTALLPIAPNALRTTAKTKPTTHQACKSNLLGASPTSTRSNKLAGACRCWRCCCLV